jgi:hypothetical protein
VERGGQDGGMMVWPNYSREGWTGERGDGRRKERRMSLAAKWRR